MSRALRLILHPFLFALAPVLFLYNQNSAEIAAGQVLRPALVLLLAASAALALLGRVLRDWQRAGLLVTLGLALFFSYGHLAGWLSQEVGSPRSERNWGLVGLWLALLAAGAWLITRRLRRPARLAPAVNLAGLFLVAWNLIGAAGGAFDYAGLRPVWWDEGPAFYKPAVDELPRAGAVSSRPDIYYIILDGYAQGGVLEDIYDLDNRPFYDFLRQQGFTVSGDSHANYPQTILSLASSLNFDYVDELVSVNRSQYSRAPLMPLLNDPRLVGFLRQQGYRFVALESGYESTDLKEADLFVELPPPLNLLEIRLIETSAARLVGFQLQTALLRRSIIERFGAAADLASLPGPKFVFIHLVAPHPPFVFDRAGGPVLPDDLTISDGSHYSQPGQVYVGRYREQLLYVNRLAQALLSEILAGSQAPPVIVLQSDHGPGAYLDWESLERTCLRERLSILNAYYLPGASLDIPPGVTPVNTFRLILDAYFDTGLGQLPDHIYYARWSRPFDPVEVTGRVDTCAPLDPVR